MTLPAAMLPTSSVVFQTLLWLGAATGLLLLLRGLALQHKGPKSARELTAKAAPTSARPSSQSTPTEPSSPGILAKEHPQNHETTRVVNLSVGLVPPESAALMTQQGKIAAALQRAQQENPRTWSAFEIPPLPALLEPAYATRDEATAGVSGGDERGTSLPKVEAGKVTGLRRAPALLEGSTPLPDSGRGRSATPPTRRWHSAALLWGGAVLSLLCLCLLAMQWGWL